MTEEFKINKEFAKKYDKYREKEELQKLKSKYRNISQDSDDSESESEDENAEGITPSLERDFLRTLSYLKNKDPSIYDKSKTFYEEPQPDESGASSEEDESRSKTPMYLKDYERKVVLENEGKYIEDLPDDEKKREIREASPSYQEEQEQIKRDLKRAISSIDGDNEQDSNNLLTKREKSSKEKLDEDEEFRKWLKTSDADFNMLEGVEAEKMKKVVQEVAPLKQYWTDPSLDDGEKFLRDYILERKYLDKDADDEIPTYDEIVGTTLDDDRSDTEDELFEKKSEMFEHKYNFRFEEPDQEFIKSYPRTIGTSVRRKDDTRKKKRDEKKKKDDEKKRKRQEELKQLKLLKKKEITDKIQKLHETTGNEELAFKQADLELEFDPEQHDKRMEEIFSKYDDDFDEEKPVFSDIEEEMEDYERYWEEDQTYDNFEADCEDPDFNMDCDYDPADQQKMKEQKKKFKQLKADASKNNKARKSAFYDSVAKEKPVFDPNAKSFEKYLEEYYALDYEDLIGDLPCRFKYRQVVANDFGLSTDEILGASDKELNAWCSLKRTVQHRAEQDELLDVKKYRRKSNNLWKKARVLKSVYETHDKTEEQAEILNEQNHESAPTMRKKKTNSRKRRRLKERQEKMKMLQDSSEAKSHECTRNIKLCETRKIAPATISPPKKTKGQRGPSSKVAKLSHDRLKAYGLEPKKYLKKMKYSSKSSTKS